MVERMRILFENPLTRVAAKSVQKWLCPCQSWQAVGSDDCNATYIGFLVHIFLKIFLTVICVKYVLSSIRARKTYFKLKAVHWTLEVVAWILAVWLPLRLTWPGVAFVFAESAKNPLEHVGKLLNIKIKPCSAFLISALTWLEVALALIALFLLFLLPLSIHLWNNFDAEYFRNLFRRFRIPWPRCTWLRKFYHRYCPNCAWLKKCFARLGNCLKKCFGRIPGLAWLRSCFLLEFPIISGLLNSIRQSGFPPPWLQNRPRYCIGADGGIGSGMNSSPSSSSGSRGSSSPGRKSTNQPTTSTASTKRPGSSRSPSPDRKSVRSTSTTSTSSAGSRGPQNSSRKSPTPSDSPGPSTRASTSRNAPNRAPQVPENVGPPGTAHIRLSNMKGAKVTYVGEMRELRSGARKSDTQ